jgi:hypothetical protein
MFIPALSGSRGSDTRVLLILILIFLLISILLPIASPVSNAVRQNPSRAKNASHRVAVQRW